MSIKDDDGQENEKRRNSYKSRGAAYSSHRSAVPYYTLTPPAETMSNVHQSYIATTTTTTLLGRVRSKVSSFEDKCEPFFS